MIINNILNTIYSISSINSMSSIDSKPPSCKPNLALLQHCPATQQEISQKIRAKRQHCWCQRQEKAGTQPDAPPVNPSSETTNIGEQGSWGNILVAQHISVYLDRDYILKHVHI